MKNIFAALVVITLLLSACTPATQQTPIPTISLDDSNTPNNSESSDSNSVAASAVIVPIREAQLSFSSIGRVTAVDVNVGDQVTAGQTLVTLDTALQEARVREAEANLLTAQVQLKYNTRLGLDEVHLETSEAEVARMQALVDSAKAVLASQSMLTAPFNGTIVTLDVAPGETVVPGTTVIVLGDLSRYTIETTDLSERDVTRVQIGQPATVFIEALEQEFPAKVTDIARTSTTLGGDVVYKVTVELDDQPDGLLWGMSADVEIQTAP
jgi:RND family efflux transporter MFP subunit